MRVKWRFAGERFFDDEPDGGDCVCLMGLSELVGWIHGWLVLEGGWGGAWARD